MRDSTEQRRHAASIDGPRRHWILARSSFFGHGFRERVLRHRRVVRALLGAALCAWLTQFGTAPNLVGAAGPCSTSGPTTTCTYLTEGTFTVPANVSLIYLQVAGGSGGSSADGRPGGYGALVRASLRVAPGDAVDTYVGENGATGSAGTNGTGVGDGGPPGQADTAGGGGAASFAELLSARVGDVSILAAGGGGAGQAPTAGDGLGGTGDQSYGIGFGNGGDGGDCGGLADGGQGAFEGGGGAGGQGYDAAGNPDPSQAGFRGLASGGGAGNYLGGGGGGGFHLSSGAGGGGGGGYNEQGSCGGGGGAGESIAAFGLIGYSLNGPYSPAAEFLNTAGVVPPEVVITYSQLYVNGSTGNNSNPCTQASPCGTINGALGKGYPGPNIFVAPGTYCEHLNLSSSAEITGQGTSTNPTVIDGGAPLSGGGTNSCSQSPTNETPGRTVTVGGGGNLVILDNVTLQNGDASNSPTAPGRGGNLYSAPNDQVFVDPSTITNGIACGTGCTGSTTPGGAGSGGAIYSAGDLTLEGVTMSGNTACTAAGCGGVSCTLASPCSGFGGAVYNAGTDPTDLSITGGSITGNTGCGGQFCAGYGGGVYNGTITDVAMSGNAACTGLDCTGYGGAADLPFSTGATVGYSTISGNDACEAAGCTGWGGALAGSPIVEHTTLSGNHGCQGNACGGTGGGISTVSYSDSAAVVNSTIVGNEACDGDQCLGDGGGVALGDSNGDSSATLVNSTVAGNVACDSSDCTVNPPGGGGLYNPGTGTGVIGLANTIVAGNTGDSAHPDCDGSVTDFVSAGAGTGGHNLIGDDTGCDTSGLTDGDQIGTGASPIVPLLGPLQDNGGLEPTMALGTGSPAIGKGDAATCAAKTVPIPVYGGGTTAVTGTDSVDQRQYVRPSGSCDIGAYDSKAAAPTRAYVRSLSFRREGKRLIVRWQVPSEQGIAGFNVFAGSHRLNGRLIAVHAKRQYRAVEGNSPGRPWLQIVLRTGRTVRVEGRSG